MCCHSGDPAGPRSIGASQTSICPQITGGSYKNADLDSVGFRPARSCISTLIWMLLSTDHTRSSEDLEYNLRPSRQDPQLGLQFDANTGTDYDGGHVVLGYTQVCHILVPHSSRKLPHASLTQPNPGRRGRMALSDFLDKMCQMNIHHSPRSPFRGI